MKKTSKGTHRLKSRVILFTLVGVLLLGAAASLLKGVGPLSQFLAAKPAVNEIKTICTRRTDGKKVCTTYNTSTSGGVKTATTNTEVISDTGGKDKVVEYKYDVVKTTPVDKKGIPTGNSTTVEVRTKVDTKTKEEKVASTVTTIQKPAQTDAAGNPVAPGEVVQEVRTGDISLGLNDKDTRNSEQKCLSDINGQPTGNTWENNTCVMKIVPKIAPASIVSTGINCDKGTCGTSGSPVCYGSYVSTGQYIKDKDGNSTGEYDCRLCGDDGKGGVSFTGVAQSCKTLLSQGAPVVLGPDANPDGLGLPTGTHTRSCMSRRGADWVLTPVGHPGEGPNEGKYCSVDGTWISEPPKLSGNPCKDGYKLGRGLGGKETCVPITNTFVEVTSSTPSTGSCVPGLGKLENKAAWIKCSQGVKTYIFCFGGTGTFDSNGKCLAGPNTSALDISKDNIPTSYQRRVPSCTSCNDNEQCAMSSSGPVCIPEIVQKRVSNCSACDPITETCTAGSSGPMCITKVVSTQQKVQNCSECNPQNQSCTAGSSGPLCIPKIDKVTREPYPLYSGAVANAQSLPSSTQRKVSSCVECSSSESCTAGSSGPMCVPKFVNESNQRRVPNCSACTGSETCTAGSSGPLCIPKVVISSSQRRVDNCSACGSEELCTAGSSGPLCIPKSTIPVKALSDNGSEQKLKAGDRCGFGILSWNCTSQCKGANFTEVKYSFPLQSSTGTATRYHCGTAAEVKEALANTPDGNYKSITDKTNQETLEVGSKCSKTFLQTKDKCVDKCLGGIYTTVTSGSNYQGVGAQYYCGTKDEVMAILNQNK